MLRLRPILSTDGGVLLLIKSVYHNRPLSLLQSVRKKLSGADPLSSVFDNILRLDKIYLLMWKC